MGKGTNTFLSFAFYRKNLSLRLSLRVVAAMNLLLMVVLLVVFLVSRRAMKWDALNRASQTLEGAMVKVDNILLSVEETSGNMYYHMRPLLSNPDVVETYRTKIVETNPYVTDCTISFKPGFYEGHDELTAGSETAWFKQTMATKTPQWLNPLDSTETDKEPLTAFCLPIPGDDGEPVGVIRVDVSLSLLSGTVATSKPSAHSYCALLDKKGMFIVHPTGEHLMQPNAFSLPGEEVRQALKTILSGDTGYMPFSIMGHDFYIFYKPFSRADVPNRAMAELGWSIAVVMSKDDIFGEFNRLFNDVIIIALGGMLLLLLSCWTILYLRLRPLKMLAGKAERIAQGHYHEPIPKTWARDEIGSLQRNFIRMRRALVARIDELEQLTATIQQRSKELKKAYKQAKKADKLKTAFLHHMTNQMVAPSQAIDKDVTALCNASANEQMAETMKRVDDIQQNGNTIAQLLNQLLNLSEEEMRKEVEHD